MVLGATPLVYGKQMSSRWQILAIIPFSLIVMSCLRPTDLSPTSSVDGCPWILSKQAIRWAWYALERGNPILAYAINPSRTRGLIV